MLLSMLVNKYLKVSHFDIHEFLKKKKNANIPHIIFFHFSRYSLFFTTASRITSAASFHFIVVSEEML